MSTMAAVSDQSIFAGDARREGGGWRGMVLVYLAMHLLPLTVLWTGPTLYEGGLCLLLALVLLQVRGFCMSAGYHRYFAHRSFKTTRLLQFLLAAGGCATLRGGPLWWASLHRHHHRYADTPEDVHSPDKGFWWSYGGWLLSGRYTVTRYDLVQDLVGYPELRWLNRWWLVPPALLGLVVLVLGGWNAFALGFCLSSALLFHTQAILDSLTHLWGTRRYATADTSRNSFLLSLLFLGEGWHNNHHHYQSSTNQGFFWYEVDPTYGTLRMMSLVGLVWDVRKPPKQVLTKNLESAPGEVLAEPTPAGSSGR
jgi:stearoyl-CoA desaturase (delta-9 desaturase)